MRLLVRVESTKKKSQNVKEMNRTPILPDVAIALKVDIAKERVDRFPNGIFCLRWVV